MFLSPEIYECDGFAVETNHGTFFLPEHVVGSNLPTRLQVIDYLPAMVVGDDILEIERRSGFFWRLSASGYLDCTEWGLSESMEELDRELEDYYDIVKNEDGEYVEACDLDE